MGFWTEKWGITKEEWTEAHIHYRSLGERLAPDKRTMERFRGLVEERRIDAALHLLCYHYNAPPVPVVKEKGDGRGLGRYVLEEKKIVLYHRAFKDAPTLLGTILHEFAHHLQNTKYPFWLYDQGIGKMHEERPAYTFSLREEFAMSYTTTAMARLGHIWR